MNIKSMETEKSTKKLVQARLPFKLLRATEKNELNPNSVPIPKQKECNTEQLPKRNPSEIVSDQKLIFSNEELVILSDEDEDEDRNSLSKNPSEEKNISINLDQQCKTPDYKSEKVFIKLPISSKKKKRKSNRLNESNEHEKSINLDEIDDKITDNKSHANKKVKISDFVIKQKFQNGLSVISDNSQKESQSDLKTIEPDLMSCDMEPTISKMETETNEHSIQGSTVAIESLPDIDISCGEHIKNSKNEDKKLNEKSKIITSDQELSNKIISSPSLNKSVIIEVDTFKNEAQMNQINNVDELNQSIFDLTNDFDIDQDLETSIKNETELKTDESKTSIDNVLQNRNSAKKERQKGDRDEMKRKEKEEREQKRIQDKLEKEEKKKKEKEEREKKRLAEIEAKNEEKRLREEEKRKREELKEEERRKREEMKEEDRKKKEDEKRKREDMKEEERKKRDEEKKKRELEKEEMENKKKKAAEVFTKFFVQSRNMKGSDDENSLNEKIEKAFMPFQIKDDMKLAPIFRRLLNCDEKKVLDDLLNKSNKLVTSKLYIENLKSGCYQPLKGSRTVPKTEDDELIIVDEMHGISQCIDGCSKTSKKYKSKFFLFCENRRPPYYGTWRKKSSYIKPRKPFNIDKQILDYDIDSDLEWEEEEPGESLNGSEDEKESEDDYEVDNEFFVPHGHLSDEEMAEEDQSPEAQKAKLKIIQQEFATEMKKKTEKLKPRLIGVVWSNNNSSNPETCPSIVWQFLKQREMIYNEKITFLPRTQSTMANNSPNQQEKQRSNKRSELPEEYIKPLIKLVHGNPNNKLFIIKEFQIFLTNNQKNSEKLHYTKSCIREKIENIAQWKVMENKTLKKKFLCWVVTKESLNKYDLSELDIQNKWKYVIPPRIKTDITVDDETIVQKPVRSTENSAVITKFAKILTKEEKERLLEKNKDDLKSISLSNCTEKNISEYKNDTNSNNKKKRVQILMSVPRGEALPETSKNLAVNEFLKKQSKISISLTTALSSVEDDNCVVID